MSPQASWYARDQIRFVKEAEKAGKPVKSVVLHEDTLFGKSTGDGQVKAAADYGIEVLDRIVYKETLT